MVANNISGGIALLQACLNGARALVEHHALPISPAAIAADAIAARAAGANALHVHPRDSDGAESLWASDIAATVRAVREAVPGMPVGVATGAWVEPDPDRRLALIEGWDVLPDYASVNLSEVGAAAVIDVLVRKGVGVEAGIWNVDDAAYFVRLPTMNHVLRVLVEMQSNDGSEATAMYRATRKVLDDAGATAPILLHGEGGSVWPMVQLARSERLDTRIGLEDGLHLPNGLIAACNAELITAARAILDGPA
jgi:uncharacterized protein (DUF849 family)